MAFSRDNQAWPEVVGADLDNLADKLMPYQHRDRNGFLRPGISVVTMQVGLAARRSLDLDQHVVDTDFRDRNFIESKSGCGLPFYQCVDGL